MANELKKCAHESCNCTVQDHQKFCSQQCEDAKDVTSLGCDCPHASCSGHAI